MRSSLPPGWKKETLGDLATISRGASPRPIASPRWFSDTSEVGWVRIADVGRSDGLTLRHTTQRLSQEGIAHSRLLPPGTLIMSIAATVGRPVITGIPACIHDGFVAIERLRGVDQMFLLYALKSMEDELKAAGQTGSQSNINTDIVSGLTIALPPELEQREIAKTLSDVDRYIDVLKRLIAKKEGAQSGVTRQLLTGATRMPGFNSRWHEIALGDVAHIKTGARNSQDKQETGRFPFFVRSATVERIDSYSYDCEAILVPGEGGIGSIYHYVDGKFEVHQRVYKISAFSSSVVGKFVYYYMREFFGRHAIENNVKAAVDSLRLPTFTAFRLRMPEDVAEQRAIADVLTDLDAGLDANRARLGKATEIKQGMMQQLLTGQTRLPAGEAVAA